MSGVWESLAAVCVVTAVSELAGRLCSENAMVRFVRALAVLVLLTSFLASVFSADLSLSLEMPETEGTGEELPRYLAEQTELAAQRELEEYLRGLLEAAEVPAEKIRAFTDIDEDGSIVLTGVTVTVSHEIDRERGEALLKNVLGTQIPVEVETNGR